ncbi:MAG: sortase [Acidimicrobiales bacterium]
MIIPVVLAVIFLLAILAVQARVLSRLPARERAPGSPADAGWDVGARRSPERPASSASGPPPADPVGRLVDLLRRRPALRRGLSLASLAAMVVAIGMIGYPFYTNVVQGRIQDRLEREFGTDDFRAAYRDGQVGVGDSLVRITIPSLRMSVVVVEGTTPQALKAGAGHYLDTALPCEPGNVGIAGHRTTYGRPFHDLDLLRPGSKIVLETPVGSCTYEVDTDPWITTPDDVAVLASSGTPFLTLTTCHPKGSARQRLIVQAHLVSSDVPAA